MLLLQKKHQETVSLLCVKNKSGAHIQKYTEIIKYINFKCGNNFCGCAHSRLISMGVTNPFGCRTAQGTKPSTDNVLLLRFPQPHRSFKRTFKELVGHGVLTKGEDQYG